MVPASRFQKVLFQFQDVTLDVDNPIELRLERPAELRSLFPEGLESVF